MHAYAGLPGSSCVDAIPMGKNYSASVQNGQSIWYSAWTFDLPLSVYFAPEHGASDPAPEVEMDFTCIPGYYADSILCSLFCKTSAASGIQFDMPHKPSLKSDILDGTFVYYLSLGKTYRDLLLQMGISYNVEVYVKVSYKSNGTISLSPDDLFSNCVDNAKFMHLGDTVNVAISDKNRHVVVPYVQWQNDTIRYKWTGTAPCIIAVANKCDFDPSVAPDDDILDYQTIVPGDSLTVTAALLSEYVNNQTNYPNEAGMYFAKFYSTAPGVIQIIKAPQAPPRKEATILRFDRTYALNANDTAVFAIPNSWNDDTLNTKFSTPTDHVFSMRIATDPDFSTEHTLKTYQFESSEDGHWQGIFASEMVGFWTHTTEQFLYVRFDCSEATTITPSKWRVDPCVTSTNKNFIHLTDTTFRVQSRSRDGNFRFLYSQWKGGDMTITFSANYKRQTCDLYIASDCNILLDVYDADNLLKYDVLQGGNTPLTIPQSEIASWASRVDEEGYIYMRFEHQINGAYYLHFTSTAPAETDPVYPTSTVTVACDNLNRPYVEVKTAQTITITNEAGGMVGQPIDAQPDTKYFLSELGSGTYTLQGETETITINL